VNDNIHYIESLVSRYKSFKTAALDNHTSLKLDSCRLVLQRYKGLEPKLLELDRKEAGHFNMFDIMKVNYFEVLVHTPILCNLLNPKGTHSQGDLFFQKFIDVVFDDSDKERFNQFDKSRIKVQDELFTRFGQIDIFVQHNNIHNPYLWIIENKIFAGDQKEQLARYLKYAMSLRGYDENNIRLIYLTPFEHNPAENSLDSTDMDILSKSRVFKVISYDKHILTWLQNCMEEIEAPVVRYTVMQYIQTLKTICR